MIQLTEIYLFALDRNVTLQTQYTNLMHENTQTFK